MASYASGATLVELGERFSIHRRTAAAHLVRRSVPIRHLAEAVELYEEGLRLMEVGLRYGVSQQAVRRALAAEGVGWSARTGRRNERLSCESGGVIRYPRDSERIGHHSIGISIGVWRRFATGVYRSTSVASVWSDTTRAYRIFRSTRSRFLLFFHQPPTG